MVPLVRQVLLVQLVLMVRPAPRDPKAKLVLRALKAVQELQVLKAIMVLLEPKVQTDPQVLRGKQESMVFPGPLVLMGEKVPEGTMEIMEIPVQPVQLVLRVKMVPLVLKVPLEPQVTKDQQALKVPPALKETKDT